MKMVILFGNQYFYVVETVNINFLEHKPAKYMVTASDKRT